MGALVEQFGDGFLFGLYGQGAVGEQPVVGFAFEEPFAAIGLCDGEPVYLGGGYGYELGLKGAGSLLALPAVEGVGGSQAEEDEEPEFPFHGVVFLGFVMGRSALVLLAYESGEELVEFLQFGLVLELLQVAVDGFFIAADGRAGLQFFGVLAGGSFAGCFEDEGVEQFEGDVVLLAVFEGLGEQVVGEVVGEDGSEVEFFALAVVDAVNAGGEAAGEFCEQVFIRFLAGVDAEGDLLPVGFGVGRKRLERVKDAIALVFRRDGACGGYEQIRGLAARGMHEQAVGGELLPEFLRHGGYGIIGCGEDVEVCSGLDLFGAGTGFGPGFAGEGFCFFCLSAKNLQELFAAAV